MGYYSTLDMAFQIEENYRHQVLDQMFDEAIGCDDEPVLIRYEGWAIKVALGNPVIEYEQIEFDTDTACEAVACQRWQDGNPGWQVLLFQFAEVRDEF